MDNGFWDHVILGFSHWAFDNNNVMIRNQTGHDEIWKCADINDQLKEKFHINLTIDCIFVDAWAKKPWNLDDIQQQEAFDRSNTII